MTDKATSPGTDAEGAATSTETVVDDLDAALEAMREAEEAGEQPQPEVKAEPNQTDEVKGKDPETDAAAEEAKKKTDEKPPLSVEEITKRWRDQQAATKQERTKRQQGDQRIEDLERQIAELRGEKPKQAASPSIPDLDEDAEGAIRAAVEFARQTQTDATENERLETAATEARNEVQQVATIVRAAEAEYVKAVPDYPEALKHFRTARLTEMQLYGMSQEDAARALQEETLDLARFAVSKNQHPAHLVYQLAQQRGYVKAADPEPSKDEQIAKAQEEIKQRKAAEKLAKTISGTGGKTVKGGPTVEQLNETASGDEFDKLFAEMAALEMGY